MWLWLVPLIGHYLAILKLSGTSHPFSFTSQFLVHRTKKLEIDLPQVTAVKGGNVCRELKKIYITKSQSFYCHYVLIVNNVDYKILPSLR